MNDRERELWVLNDETLYEWWRSSRGAGGKSLIGRQMGIRRFIRENQKEIDTYINEQLNKKPSGGNHEK